MSFSSGVRRSVRRIESQIERHARQVIFDLFTRVVLRSPVDTGRFRGNWNVSLNSIDRSVSVDSFKGGAAVQQDITSTTGSFKLGDDAYLANNLPYAVPLETGWSRQAPQGMIRISLLELSDA